MDPLHFLFLLLCVTALAAVWQWGAASARRRALGRLARSWQMHFAHDDRFHLARRITRRLPAIGAADIEARDVMYSTEGEQRYYLFTVEYGRGAVINQRRRRCVALLEEPAGPDRPEETASGTLLFGEQELGLLEQYRRLRERRT